MRPIDLNKAFHLSVDTLTCLWGGLLIPKLLSKETESALKDHNLLLTLDSTVDEATHIDKQNYLNITKSTQRSMDVGNSALCMLAVFAYESLKSHPSFDLVKNHETIKFMRHLRNAGAHGNKFHFYTKNKFCDPGIVKWRTKIIDSRLQGCIAFPSFIAHGDYPYLLEDVSLILNVAVDDENSISI